MKKRINWLLIGVFLMAGLLVVYASQAEEAKVTVLNPQGTPPPIRLVPMAPRLDTLAGKTIYIVDIRFPDTLQLLEEMQKMFAKRYPEAKWVLKKKLGAYAEDDPKLWAEIKEKGHAMVMGVGH